MSESPRQSAAMAGERIYVGKPCARCHGQERYTLSSICVACAKRSASEHRRRVADMMRDAREGRAQSAIGG